MGDASSKAAYDVSDAAREKIIDALCSQALADHLGDVRDAEEALWTVLGVPPLPYDHPVWGTDSAYQVAKARLRAAGLDVPEYLRGSDDE